MRLPHTIGLDVPRPGTATFHLMFFPVVTSHSPSTPWPSPTPAAFAPRNEGQLIGAARSGSAEARDSVRLRSPASVGSLRRIAMFGSGAADVASPNPSRSYRTD